jgi:hypothetical protein
MAGLQFRVHRGWAGSDKNVVFPLTAGNSGSRWLCQNNGLILRISGFGYSMEFLLPSQCDRHALLVQNNQFDWSFFEPAMARLPEPIYLRQVKALDKVRNIVIGESAAQADPQSRFGLSRLESLLLVTRFSFDPVRRTLRVGLILYIHHYPVGHLLCLDAKD